MNKRVIAAIASLVIFTLGSTKYAYAQAPTGKVDQENPFVEVQLNLKSQSEDSVVLEILVKNSGSLPLYVVTDPRRLDGSKGPYLQTDSVDQSMLLCTFQMYPPDPFNPFLERTSVHLTRLEAGESHVEVVKLSWPLRTTEPPFASAPGTTDVQAKSIKQIQVRVGVLRASAAFMELMTRKKVPYDAYTGGERIKLGSVLKSLYEIQEVIRSNVVGISFD